MLLKKAPGYSGRYKQLIFLLKIVNTQISRMKDELLKFILDPKF